QTVTVTGQDDAVQDGNQLYAVHFVATTGADTIYNALAPPSDVLMQNNDNDVAAVSVLPATPPRLITSEPNGTATFTIVLVTQPTGNVTVNFNTTSAAEGRFAASATSSFVSFTTANWNAPQTVTVTGQDDAVQDGNQLYAVHFVATTGADTIYNALAPPADVLMQNNDNDVAAVSVLPATPPRLITSEPNGTATFTIVLVTQPTGNVTVNFNTTSAAEGRFAASATSSFVSFTSANWNAPQTVTV